MQFKELKSNYIVYVFDRKEISCREEKVVSVSVPRFDNKVGQQAGMVVDVTIERDGMQNTYVFPDGGSKAYCGNLMFCVDKGDVIADVRSILRADEQYIADVDKKKDEAERCQLLLGELDTEVKAKQEIENRLVKMENRFDNIESLLREIAGKRM